MTVRSVLRINSVPLLAFLLPQEQTSKPHFKQASWEYTNVQNDREEEKGRTKQ